MEIEFCDWNGCVLAAGHIGTCRQIYGQFINGPRAMIMKCPCLKCSPERAFDKLLECDYNPPKLFIFEEVEIRGGYHTLDVSDSNVESDWSEPYKKNGGAEYRSRVVSVPFPPEKY